MKSSSISVKTMTLTAIFLGMNVVLSSISVPVPGGHLYLNDIVIILASILLAPELAFIVGGVGSFLGDFFFYPVTMFISLVVHGVQGYVMSYLYHSYKGPHKEKRAILVAILGSIIMITGYSLAKIYIYSTLAHAIAKLPFELLQAIVCVSCAILLLFHTSLLPYFQQRQYKKK